MQSVRRLISTFSPKHYSLSLTINRVERTFNGLVTIEGTTTDQQLIRLHSKDLSIQSVLVDGHQAAFSQGDNDELIIDAELAGNSHTIVVSFSGTITDQMHGMYPCYFSDDTGKKELIATQFESHHAREVFPCVDEPEAKATFDVTLTTERGVTVLGNMPVASQKEEAGQLVTTFQQTPRMSSYLLAWVIGDLQKKSATTKRGVEVNVWATSAHEPASLDFALDFATKTIDYFEDYFGVDYPLPKSDHVALPDFTSGAMENWGLITYREIALLADPATATIDSKHYIAMVVGHELSHQWFGNLVTMRWWDNLWLNESFANFIENLPIDAMHPDWGIWMDYASTWSLMAMRRDAIAGVQPVQVDVNHPDEISSLFDGAIMYGKGGRLIGMLREYVGEDDFRKGLKQYFTKFAYQNTTGDDLWDCLEAVSGKPIREFMNQWILRPGYPVVHVDTGGLRQEQFFIGEHPASKTLWPIPLAAEPTGILPATLETESLEATIPSSLRLNVGNWSHFVTNYAEPHFNGLLENISEYQPLERLQLLNERVLLARSGHVRNSSLLPMLRASTNENQESVWNILNLALSELKKFVEFDDASRAKLKKLARDITNTQFTRLGWDKITSETENDTKLRPLIIGQRLFGEDSAVIDEAARRFTAAQSIEALDPELRGVILVGYVKKGLTSDQFDQLVNLYVSSVSAAVKEDVMNALTATEDNAQIDKLLECIMDTAIVRPQDATHWYVDLLRSRFAKASAWKWLQGNWDWVVKTYGGDKNYDDFVRYSAGVLSTPDQLSEFTWFFRPMKSEPALLRVIELGEKEIKARVDLIEHDGQDVRRALLDDK
jgi:aminopeptidase N